VTAMIFQQESVFPWLTVQDNAAYGLRVTGA
jgi:NitT/TauT family transport system ATP-binding protein